MEEEPTRQLGSTVVQLLRILRFPKGFRKPSLPKPALHAIRAMHV